MADVSSAIPVAGKIGDDNQQARQRVHQHYTQTATGDGTKVFFPLQKTPSNPSQIQVYVSGLRMTASALGVANDYSVTGSAITFTTAPANTAKITFDLIAS